jgi:hypothetical protein
VHQGDRRCVDDGLEVDDDGGVLEVDDGGGLEVEDGGDVLPVDSCVL